MAGKTSLKSKRRPNPVTRRKWYQPNLRTRLDRAEKRWPHGTPKTYSGPQSVGRPMVRALRPFYGQVFDEHPRPQVAQYQRVAYDAARGAPQLHQAHDTHKGWTAQRQPIPHVAVRPHAKKSPRGTVLQRYGRLYKPTPFNY